MTVLCGGNLHVYLSGTVSSSYDKTFMTRLENNPEKILSKNKGKQLIKNLYKGVSLAVGFFCVTTRKDPFSYDNYSGQGTAVSISAKHMYLTASVGLCNLDFGAGYTITGGLNGSLSLGYCKFKKLYTKSFRTVEEMIRSGVRRMAV